MGDSANNSGANGQQLDWQKQQTFVSMVKELRLHHSQLWFRLGGDVSLPAECKVKQWKSCEILLPNERILAMQTGNGNQWQLTRHYSIPDRCPVSEEIPDCQELTDDFYHVVSGNILILNLSNHGPH